MYKRQGETIEGVLKEWQIATDFVYVDGETRTNLKVVENSGEVTELNEPGPEVSAEQLERLMQKLEGYAGEDTLFVLALSLIHIFAGKGSAKSSAPGAVIIHFLGGIHEIYFPYILMNPLLLLSAIAGGASGVFTFTLMGAGLTAPASPGSIPVSYTHLAIRTCSGDWQKKISTRTGI